MIHENADSFRCGCFHLVLIVATDLYGHVIGNTKLHCRDCFDASAFEFAKPLVRPIVVLQDGCRKNPLLRTAMKFLGLDAVFLDQRDIAIVGEVDKLRHPGQWSYWLGEQLFDDWLR